MDQSGVRSEVRKQADDVGCLLIALVAPIIYLLWEILQAIKELR